MKFVLKLGNISTLKALHHEDVVKGIQISKRNIKLNLPSFSLPPVVTCPNCNICKKHCYALKFYKMYKQTKTAYNRNLRLSLKGNFSLMVIEKLRKIKNLDYFRLHTSGDFYNQDYFNKWLEVFKAFPKTTFYTYTKNYKLDLTHKPKNLVLLFSEDGAHSKEWALSHNYNGYTRVRKETDHLKGFVCKGQKNNQYCGKTCFKCIKGKNIDVTFKLH